MQSSHLSLQTVLEALDLDAACLPLLEQADEYHSLLSASSPETVYNTIRSIGRLLNVQQQANQLVENLEERINIIIHKLKFIANDNRPKVLCLTDVSPMADAHSHYLDGLVRIAGGVIDTNTTTSKWDPDILIIISEKPIPTLLDELPAAFSTGGWPQTKAIANSQIYIVHNPKYLRQPSAYLADDAEILAEIIQPKYFIFGRDEDAWMKFEWQ